MNKKHLIWVTLGILHLNETVCFWGKNKPANTCRLPDITGTYPEQLCNGVNDFLIQLKLFKLQDKIKENTGNLDAVKKDDHDASGKLKKHTTKFNELREKHPMFFLENGELAPEASNVMLLHGPSGTGKTMLAKKIAERSKSQFVHLSGGSIITTFQNEGAQKIRSFISNTNALINSKKADSVIIFIDEIDRLMPPETSSNAKDYETAISELWQFLDQIKDCPRVCLIAATNNFGNLDKTLLARFDADSRIEIDVPDTQMRKELIALFLAKRRLTKLNDLKDAKSAHGYFSSKSNEDAILDYLAYQTSDKSVRYIEQYATIVSRYAFRHNNGVLTFAILKQSLEKIKEQEKEEMALQKAAEQKQKEKQQAIHSNRSVKGFFYDLSVLLIRDLIMRGVDASFRDKDDKKNAHSNSNTNTEGQQ